jgi:hypothetical protein
METSFLARDLRPGQVLSYIPGRYNPPRNRNAAWPAIAGVARDSNTIVVTITDERGDRKLKFGPDELVPVIQDL